MNPACGGEPCPACGDRPLRTARVHGHDQCVRCGCNVAPCCQPDMHSGDEPAPGLLRSAVLGHVPHGFTTRRGGVSSGVYGSLNFGSPGDLPQDQRDTAVNIRENYRRVLHAIGCGRRELVEVHQVHGSDVHVVRRGDKSHAGESDTRADAIVTDDPSRVVSVRTADCAPVLAASADGRVVAAIHAGWRGVLAGVVPAAVGVMRTLSQQPLAAAIGPCIGRDALEVDADIADRFRAAFAGHPEIVRPDAERPGKFWIDMPAALVVQLRRLGVSSVEVIARCTVTEPGEFFSHRAHARRTGRMAAVIGPVN